MVSAEISEVVAAVLVGELVEVIIAFIGIDAKKASIGVVSLQEELVFTARKNFEDDVAMVLLMVSGIEVTPSIVTDVCVPASKSVDGSKIPSPLSLYMVSDEISAPLNVLDAVLLSVTLTDDSVSPPSCESVNEKRPVGVLDAGADVGEVTNEVGPLNRLTAAKAGWIAKESTERPKNIAIFFICLIILLILTIYMTENSRFSYKVALLCLLPGIFVY